MKAVIVPQLLVLALCALALARCGAPETQLRDRALVPARLAK